MPNFAKGSIEFLTVAIQFCQYIETSLNQESRKSTTKKLAQLLSILYLKATMVETTDRIYEEEPERFVDENDYNAVMADIQQLLGTEDQYLTALHPDIALSDTTVVATISEDIADIYQPLKDFVSVAQLGNDELMNDALIICMEQFYDYWGTRLLSATLALHQLFTSSTDLEDEEE